MTAIFQFNGIYTPIVTPYRYDGTVHWDALAAVVDFLLAAGVHGVISGGSTGENYTQTVAERVALAQFVQARINRRCPFVVGTGAMLTDESLVLATEAREMKGVGAAAILVYHSACFFASHYGCGDLLE